ncbi:MAG: hypothetical protein AAF533_01025 [Acidobacteriota bacterium]
MTTTDVHQLDWSIVPGPEVLPAPCSPSDRVVETIAEHSPEHVAQTLLSLPGVGLVQDSGDWWEWRARHRGRHDVFEITMTLFETQPPLWGGCELVGRPSASGLAAFAEQVAAVLPGTYLHGSDARLYTLDGFRSQFS